MKILFLGDICGSVGRNVVLEKLKQLKEEYAIDFTIVNGENAAHGKGITAKIYRSLKEAGVDVVTLGNHAFSKSEIKLTINECTDLVRPINMNPTDIGNGYIIRKCGNKKIAVVNICGSVFMDNIAEDPYSAMEDIIDDLVDEADIIFVDIHAEATSEKILFFEYFKQYLTVVAGTHTHVQTADERVKDGCAFICDVGMCGAYESILGRDIDEVIEHTVNCEKTHFTPAQGEAILCGIVVTIDDKTSRATHIERIQLRPY